MVSSLPPLCVSAHSCKCVPGDTFPLRQGTHWLEHWELACPLSPQCWDCKHAHYNAWLFFCGFWGLSMCPHPLPAGLSPQSLSLSHALAADSLSSLWAFTLSSCHQALKFQGQILHIRNFKWSNSPLCPCWSQLMLTGTSEATVSHHENDCHLEETQCSSSGSRHPRWSPAQF